RNPSRVQARFLDSGFSRCAAAPERRTDGIERPSLRRPRSGALLEIDLGGGKLDQRAVLPLAAHRLAIAKGQNAEAVRPAVAISAGIVVAGLAALEPLHRALALGQAILARAHPAHGFMRLRRGKPCAGWARARMAWPRARARCNGSSAASPATTIPALIATAGRTASAF